VQARDHAFQNGLASSLVLQSILPGLAGVLLNKQAELTFVTVVNALLANAADAPLFIGLSVLSYARSESE